MPYGADSIENRFDDFVEETNKKIEELEAKVEAAQVESVEENVKIETKIVTKTQVIKQRGEDIIHFVDKESVKYDTKFLPGGICEIPKEFIEAHNKAAEAPK